MTCLRLMQHGRPILSVQTVRRTFLLPSGFPLMTLLDHSEIEASLESLSALHSSYLRILRTVPPESHPTSQEVRESQQELRQTLSILRSDVQELEESVKALLNPHVADRLQISQSQINERRNFVDRVKSELKVIWSFFSIAVCADRRWQAVQLSLSSTSSDFAQPTPVRPTTSSLIASTSSYRDTPPPPNDDDDDQAAFERQHQTVCLVPHIHRDSCSDNA